MPLPRLFRRPESRWDRLIAAIEDQNTLTRAWLSHVGVNVPAKPPSAGTKPSRKRTAQDVTVRTRERIREWQEEDDRRFRSQRSPVTEDSPGVSPTHERGPEDATAFVRPPPAPRD